MEKVIMTKCMVNIYTAQVCAEKELPDEEILSLINASDPSGTSNGWIHVVREVTDVFNENCMPKQCANYPNRMHYLITC